MPARRKSSGKRPADPPRRGAFDEGSRRRIACCVSLAVVIAWVLFAHYRIAGPLQQLPSPLYGGDDYFQLGQTNHVAAGGNPLGSATIEGTLPAYFVTYSLLSGTATWIMGSDAITGELAFSTLVVVTAAVVMFLLAFQVTGAPGSAALAAILLVNPKLMPVLKYTHFTALTMVPLLLLVLHRFRNGRSIQRALLVGIVYGVASLSHSAGFIGGSLLLASSFAVDLWGVWRRAEISAAWQLLQAYSVILVVGLPIALLYWWDPIFVHHFKTSPHYLEWNHADLGRFDDQVASLLDWLGRRFFSFGNLRAGTLSLLSLLGLVSLGSAVRRRKTPPTRRKERRAAAQRPETSPVNTDSAGTLILLLVVGVGLSYHHLLTMQLFGFHLVPSRLRMFLYPAVLCLIASGAHYVYCRLSSVPWLRLGYYPALFVLVLVLQNKSVEAKFADRWYKKGCTELAAQWIDLAAYLKENTRISDTILTTKELGFAVNALSGRKLLATRRAHNDAFVDMDERELDEALILYGSDPKMRRALLRKHKIDYLYWSDYWIRSEYRFSAQGKLTGTFDPLIAFATEEHERLLRDNGVKFRVATTWVDPAFRGKKYPRFKMILVLPSNYRGARTPWRADLDPLLEKVWHFETRGREIACLYRVRLPVPDTAAE